MNLAGRVARLDRSMPAETPSPPGPSGFDVVSAYVAERGGMLPHESMAGALARLLGVSSRDIRDALSPSGR